MTKKQIKEMNKPTPISERFFDGNKKFAKEVKLTKEEQDLFDKFEWAVLCNNGLRQISGGYAKVTIYETDEDNKILICEVECGEQGEGSSSCDKWEVIFDRVTKKFEEN